MRQVRARRTGVSAPAGTTWLLQCLVHCTRENRGATLRDIIAFGDFINHAVFEYKEFCSALRYLMGAQIAFVRRNRIHLTRKFRTLLPARVAQQKRPAYAKEYAALESYLSEVQPVASSGQTPIPKKAFAQAVAAYLDSAVSDLKNKK